MKKIFGLVLAFLAFGFNVAVSAPAEIEIYEPNSKNFRDGFEAGIKAIDFQAKTDGFQQKLIKINKPFLLIFDIKNTPLHEALFFQIITAREGFDTHFTKDFVSLGEFEREVDAKDAKDLLVRKYKVSPNDLKILKNQANIVSYPFLFHNFYKRILLDAQKAGYIVQTEVIYGNSVNLGSSSAKKTTAKVKSKQITFKNPRVMSYKLFGSSANSTSFTETGLMKAEKFDFDREVTTGEGEKFVKVKGRNLYFSISDIQDIK